MSPADVGLSLGASLLAALVGLGGGWLAMTVLKAVGLPVLQPVAVVATVFLSLTLLPSAWDRVAARLDH